MTDAQYGSAWSQCMERVTWLRDHARSTDDDGGARRAYDRANGILDALDIFNMAARS